MSFCFLEAGSDTPELLELRGAALHQVALGIDVLVEGMFVRPRRTVVQKQTSRTTALIYFDF